MTRAVGDRFFGTMSVVAALTAITVARLGHRGIPGVEFPDAEGVLLLNFAAAIVFTALVAAGWYFRRKPQVHKRLMLMATVGGLMPPGISRLPPVVAPISALPTWHHIATWLMQ